MQLGREAAVQGSGRVGRYRFTPSVLQELKPFLTQRDNWHGPAWLLEDWLVIISTVALTEWVRQEAGTAAFLLLYPLAVLVIGARQRGLATLLHDAAHRTLAGSRAVNFLTGTVLAGYPVLQSYTGYRATHVRQHHPLDRFGTYGLDPDYSEIVNLGLYDWGLGEGRVRRYLRGIIGPVPTLKYALYLYRNRVLAPGECRLERVARFLYLGFVTGALVCLGFWQEVALYWLVPLLTAANWIGSLSELVEHFPYIETRPRVDVFLSRNTIGTAAASFFLSVHNDAYHRVHHLFPSVSGWNYREVHAILMRDQVYAALHAAPGWRDSLREVLNAYPKEQPAGRQAVAGS